MQNQFWAAAATLLLLGAGAHDLLAVTPCTAPPPGMAAWWPGDGGAQDIAGPYHGTASGVSFTPGRVAQAFTFQGTGGVNFGAGIGNFGTADFTIDFWLKTNSQLDQAILEKRAVCSFSDFWSIRLIGTGNVISAANAGQLVIELNNTSSATNSGYALLYSQVTVNDGQYHHVTVTRAGTTVAVYIDGVATASVTTANVIAVGNSAPTVAGASVCTGLDSTLPLVGQLDEIEIFGRALAPAEIAALAGAALGKCLPVTIDIKPGSCPSPVNLTSNGVTPVAIYGSLLVDVARIDWFSLTFGGNAVKKAGKSLQCRIDNLPLYACNAPSAPPDAYPDLVCHFETEAAETSGVNQFEVKGIVQTPSGYRGIIGVGYGRIVP